MAQIDKNYRVTAFPLQAGGGKMRLDNIGCRFDFDRERRYNEAPSLGRQSRL